MLCTLSDVKALLGITGDSQDAKLTLYIKQASAMVESFIGYSLAYGDYTEEVHCVNDRQLLPLNHFPLRSVTSVTSNGVAVDDWKLIPEFSRWGNLYRGNGWTGGEYTRGFTHDVVSGVFEIIVNYSAGYYLPGDTHYVEGAADSLPYVIVTACMKTVELLYSYESMGAVGLKAHHEGNISDTFADGASDTDLSSGVKKMLAPFVRIGLA